MAPRRTSKRKQPTPRGSEIVASVDFDQMISECLAAAIPDFVSKVCAGVLQSIGGSNPGGSDNRTEVGGSVGRDSGAVRSGVTGTLQRTEKIGTAFEICGCADGSKAIVAAGALTDDEMRDDHMPTCEDERNSGCKRSRDSQREDPEEKRSREDVRNPTPVQSFTVVYPKRTEYAGPWPECSKCGRHHLRSLACWVCSRCKMLGHTEEFCKTCFDCDRPDHRKDRCPKSGNPSDSSRVRGRSAGGSAGS